MVGITTRDNRKARETLTDIGKLRRKEEAAKAGLILPGGDNDPA